MNDRRSLVVMEDNSGDGRWLYEDYGIGGEFVIHTQYDVGCVACMFRTCRALKDRVFLCPDPLLRGRVVQPD